MPGAAEAGKHRGNCWETVRAGIDLEMKQQSSEILENTICFRKIGCFEVLKKCTVQNTYIYIYIIYI